MIGEVIDGRMHRDRTSLALSASLGDCRSAPRPTRSETELIRIGVEQVDAGNEVHEQEAAEFPVYRK